jgi:hypothetical protein
MRATNGGAGRFTFAVDEDAVPDAVAFFAPVLESLAVVVSEPGAGLTAGNNSCETAITMSERNRARKKRLSIQGTGS